MIWLKRLLPFVILGVAGLSFHLIRRHEATDRAKQEEKYANIAAQVWVASATYRNNPDQFRLFRDSLLSANGITVEQMYDFIRKHKETPEAIDQFAYKMQAGVDSLVHFQDSLRRARADSIRADSLAKADTLSSEPQKHSDSVPSSPPKK